MPEFYEHPSPIPYEAPAQMEKDLAEELRRAGYTVRGGHENRVNLQWADLNYVEPELGDESPETKPPLPGH
jgi:hypothetical protein